MELVDQVGAPLPALAHAFAHWQPRLTAPCLQGGRLHGWRHHCRWAILFTLLSARALHIVLSCSTFDIPSNERIGELFALNSPLVGTDDLAPIFAAAKDAGVNVVLPITERDNQGAG